MPKLVHFNSYTKFREAVSFIAFSNGDDDSTLVRIETFMSDDGLANIRMTTSKGITAIADATVKSEMLDSPVCVNLHDFCVMCDKGVKENDCALWYDDGRLYIGSCFNRDLNCFESECSLPSASDFTIETKFEENEKITLEQSMAAEISDSCYAFKYVEIWRIDGIVSFRTGDDKVSIATIFINSTANGVQQVDMEKQNLSIRIPVSVFKVLGMADSGASFDILLDTTRHMLKVAGNAYSVVYSYDEGIFTSDSPEGMTDYIKFDSIAMMATVDMIYGINYLDPIAPVTIRPIDETTISIEIASNDRYAATITMPGVRVYDTTKSIVLPMDVATMMVRNCFCKTLLLKVDDGGRLFMCYQNKSLARKCMYFGG